MTVRHGAPEALASGAYAALVLVRTIGFAGLQGTQALMGKCRDILKIDLRKFQHCFL